MHNPRKLYRYTMFHPYSDDSLLIAINACYKQVFGNFNLMISERPVELERRLRNGDLPIREFIRQLAKSPFYRLHYFEQVSQLRCIELSFKHLLGRPPINREEINKQIKLIHDFGFNCHIDDLIDSAEYEEIFGSSIVPYERCWNSPSGIRTSTFINAIILKKAITTSDNTVHKYQSFLQFECRPTKNFK